MKKGSLSQKYKDGSAFKNQCNSLYSRSKNKTYMINSINADNSFEKIQKFIHDKKNSQIARNIRQLPPPDKIFCLHDA